MKSTLSCTVDHSVNDPLPIRSGPFLSLEGPFLIFILIRSLGLIFGAASVISFRGRWILNWLAIMFNGFALKVKKIIFFCLMRNFPPMPWLRLGAWLVTCLTMKKNFTNLHANPNIYCYEVFKEYPIQEALKITNLSRYVLYCNLIKKYAKLVLRQNFSFDLKKMYYFNLRKCWYAHNVC